MALLENRNAIIYGGGGGLGSAIGAAFAAEGARVHLAGRTATALDTAARAVTEAAGPDGPAAETVVLDATDEKAVDAHVAEVAARHGSVDVSLNLISRGDVQGTPLIDMTTADLLRATTVGLQSSFVTARAAARQMVRQGSGVVLHLNSGSGAGAHPGMGSTGPADAATESFMRYLAAEVGPAGVRVVGLWTAGVAETLTDAAIADVAGTDAPSAHNALAMIAGMSVLRRTPYLVDVTGAAVFLASDHASGITGTMVNVSAGLVLR